MKPFTPLDPSSMSAEARVAEVAATLARALVRLRAQPNPRDVRENQEDLGFSPPQRVHSNPAVRVRKAARAAAVKQQQGV
ncbi:hypothetical protein CJO81_13800 [Ralstonia solanacearum]|nr:hypothetical protein CJO74_05765 [Ralstonia solanacearum]AXV68885.1 hypothetical protein CJO74_06070 [Ralstonia solanacearum]AXV96479.1 hypothetical protein CJO80_13410 [Ralstonia solanacearum]AXV96528.1 hypothetical protein CJO80_13715 [Ralstonia solanacearum]AXW01742.1 hypothetical protein CJO81_13800 [Ralstonia solanacearum]